MSNASSPGFRAGAKSPEIAAACRSRTRLITSPSGRVPCKLAAYLAIAIVAEVIGTSALKAAAGFTRLGPSAVVVAAYGLSFYFLSLTLQTIPVGVTYAIWSGVGIVLITLIAWLMYGQTLRPGRVHRPGPDHRGRVCASMPMNVVSCRTNRCRT